MLKRLKTKNLKKPVIQPTHRLVVEDIGEILQLSNGNEFFMLHVREGMEGHRVSEFFITKKLGAGIHVKKKGKRKK